MLPKLAIFIVRQVTNISLTTRQIVDPKTDRKRLQE